MEALWRVSTKLAAGASWPGYLHPSCLPAVPTSRAVPPPYPDCLHHERECAEREQPELHHVRRRWGGGGDDGSNTWHGVVGSTRWEESWGSRKRKTSCTLSVRENCVCAVCREAIQQGGVDDFVLCPSPTPSLPPSLPPPFSLTLFASTLVPPSLPPSVFPSLPPSLPPSLCPSIPSSVHPSRTLFQTSLPPSGPPPLTCNTLSTMSLTAVSR